MCWTTGLHPNLYVDWRYKFVVRSFEVNSVVKRNNHKRDNFPQLISSKMRYSNTHPLDPVHVLSHNTIQAQFCQPC